MLTVSLHGIKIHAPIGLYAGEKITGNDFEIDVDLFLADTFPWPFADYSIVFDTVVEEFARPGELIEQFVLSIHTALKMKMPCADRIRVVIRKMTPPLSGPVAYSQVCYEQ